MSRLPPALGLAPMGVRQPQVASKQQQAFEQDTGQAPERLHFVPRESVDATLQVGVRVASDPLDHHWIIIIL